MRLSRRIESSYLALIPSLITAFLALVCLSAKHISGLDHFMPVLPALPIYYWGMVRAKDIPFIFIFAMGVIMDAVTGLPLGVSSLMYLVFMIVLYTQRKYIHKEGFAIKWSFFAIILGAATVFNWVLLSFFYSQIQPIGPVILQWLFTFCCYPFAHKAFDGVYSYVQSRRWQIQHGH